MITLYHAPCTRSSSIIWLLEELAVPYRIELTSIVYGATGEGSPAPDSYRQIHPHKKVPAIDHDGNIVFESAAIALYLADAFPQAGLAPPIGDNGRAAYVTWLAYYAGVIGPVGVTHLLGMDKEKPTTFGTFEDMEAFMARTLQARPYIAGENFTAADVLVGSAILYFKSSLLPARKVYDDYVARLQARPAFKRALEKDNG
jgi:glutathione S-transferase